VKKKLLISFSGGRTSAYMTWWLLNHCQDKYEMIIVFANTGKEKEATLNFVHRCDLHFGFNTVWIEGVTDPRTKYGNNVKVVDFATADRNGKPFEEMIKKHGIPNITSPHCSRELKERSIRAYAISIGWKFKEYKTAIGIRADEPRRLNWKNAKRKNLIYPFATLKRTTKSDINLFWSKQQFDLELKSYEGNCDFCWKKSCRKLMTIAKENPQVTTWWQEMETKYANHIPAHRSENKNIKLPVRFFRDNMTVSDIIEDAKFPFRESIDDSKKIDQYSQLQIWNPDLDENGGCVESCEAF